MKKLRMPHEPDPVGTRCPASGLGFRLWTRGSASLPFNFFTALGPGVGCGLKPRTHLAAWATPAKRGFS